MQKQIYYVALALLWISCIISLVLNVATGGAWTDLSLPALIVAFILLLIASVLTVRQISFSMKDQGIANNIEVKVTNQGNVDSNNHKNGEFGDFNTTDTEATVISGKTKGNTTVINHEEMFDNIMFSINRNYFIPIKESEYFSGKQDVKHCDYIGALLKIEYITLIGIKFGDDIKGREVVLAWREFLDIQQSIRRHANARRSRDVFGALCLISSQTPKQELLDLIEEQQDESYLMSVICLFDFGAGDLHYFKHPRQSRSATTDEELLFQQHGFSTSILSYIGLPEILSYARKLHKV